MALPVPSNNRCFPIPVRKQLPLLPEETSAEGGAHGMPGSQLKNSAKGIGMQRAVRAKHGPLRARRRTGAHVKCYQISSVEILANMFGRVAPLPAVCSCVRGAHWVVRRGALVCCPLGLRAGPRAAQNLLPCAAGRVAPHFLGRFCSQAQKTQALNLFFAYVCSDDAKTTSFLSPAFRPGRACGGKKVGTKKSFFR